MFYGRHKLLYAFEDPSANTFSRDLPEPAFYQIKPGRTRRRKMEVETRMFVEPSLNIGVIVGPVVIEDHVDIETLGCFPVYGAQELKELGVPVPGIAGADDLPFQNIECGKETGGAVSLVVVGHCPTAPFLHRESRLRSVQRLHLRFFIYTEHYRFVGWV